MNCKSTLKRILKHYANLRHLYYQKSLPIQAEKWYLMPISLGIQAQEKRKERNESAGKFL